jgi:hypothetical protein
VNWLLLSLLAAASSPDAEPAREDRPGLSPILPRLDPCLRPDRDEEIVVCGRRDRSDRYRLPPSLRGEAEAGRRIPGLGPPTIDAEPHAPCGIFQGQRKCSKADAAEFGYGNGRDPITVVGKIVSELGEPD